MYRGCISTTPFLIKNCNLFVQCTYKYYKSIKTNKMRKIILILSVLSIIVLSGCSSQYGYSTSKKKGFSRDQKWMSRHRNIGGLNCGGMAGGVNRPIQ